FSGVFRFCRTEHRGREIYPKCAVRLDLHASVGGYTQSLFLRRQARRLRRPNIWFKGGVIFMTDNKRRRLFLGCFMALIATAFGFVVRGGILPELRSQFNLSNEQIGWIQGAGLFPFAISIVFFSLIVDKIGYGRTMAFAFLGHICSAIIT